MGCFAEYQLKLLELKEFQKSVESRTLSLIKEHGEPFTIGNVIYWIAERDDEKVPGYYYLHEYTKGCEFLPIWDEHEECEYGWFFYEACRIFQRIQETLNK